jgi:hypothetical protein
MAPILRLYEDVMSNAAAGVALPALARMIFVVHGAVVIGGTRLADGEAWQGEGAVTLAAGAAGATCWRFELAPAGAAGGGGAHDGAASGRGVSSRAKLTAALETLPAGDLILRGDSVAFPPGGCAYLHRHQGPGIRCLIEGGIRIDTLGHSTSYGPGCAWYEAGPDPVFAQAAVDRPSRFVRVMLLPRAWLGKSSVEYLNPDDRNKPRLQEYKIFADAPIAFRLT